MVCGYESGGSLAFLSAFNHRESIRAVAAVEAVPITPLPENEPLRRLAVYVASSAKSLLAAAITSAVTRLREMKFPVVVKKLGTAARSECRGVGGVGAVGRHAGPDLSARTKRLQAGKQGAEVVSAREVSRLARSSGENRLPPLRTA